MERHQEIELVHAEMFAERIAKRARHAQNGTAPSVKLNLDDAALLDKARNARNGAEFTALYDLGDTSRYDGDDSKADFALMCALLFWTQGDTGRAERLFSESKLGQREKWRQRPDYRERTITNAAQQVTEYYDPSWRTNSHNNGDSDNPGPPGPGASKETKGEPSATLADVYPYRETEYGLIRYKVTGEDEQRFPLTNFRARVVADIAHDDGTEVARAMEIEAMLRGRISRFVIPASTFNSMRWAIEKLGSGAIVYAGSGTTDHARAAIQLLSKEHPARTIYTHTGWRQINGAWVYLHAGGAISAQGAIDGIEVSLPPALADFQLPEPPADPIAAIRASLRVLDVGPDYLTFSVYPASWRAILGG